MPRYNLFSAKALQKSPLWDTLPQITRWRLEGAKHYCPDCQCPHCSEMRPTVTLLLDARRKEYAGIRAQQPRNPDDPKILKALEGAEDLGEYIWQGHEVWHLWRTPRGAYIARTHTGRLMRCDRFEVEGGAAWAHAPGYDPQDAERYPPPLVKKEEAA